MGCANIIVEAVKRHFLEAISDHGHRTIRHLVCGGVRILTGYDETRHSPTNALFIKLGKV
jgi:hypothetical protein